MVIKSVKVSRETHQRLTQIGRKNESYNDIITRLLDEYEKKSPHHP